MDHNKLKNNSSNKIPFSTLVIPLLVTTLLPKKASAQFFTCNAASCTFRDYVNYLLSQFSSLAGALIVLAIVIFLIGIFKYSLSAGSNPQSRSDLGKYLMYGLIAIFVMSSFWALISFVLNSVRIG